MKLQAYADEVRSSAFHRNKALAKLSDLQLTIAEHLFKIVHYKDHPAYSSWLKELRAWNGQLRRLHKSKKKYGNYTRKSLLKALWHEPLGDLADQTELAAQLVNQGFTKVTIDGVKLKATVEKFIDDVLNPAAGHTFTP